MPNRRDLFKLAAFQAMAGAALAAKIPNATMDQGKAKVTHEPFGELRVYFDGSTDGPGTAPPFGTTWNSAVTVCPAPMSPASFASLLKSSV